MPTQKSQSCWESAEEYCFFCVFVALFFYWSCSLTNSTVQCVFHQFIISGASVHNNASLCLVSEKPSFENEFFRSSELSSKLFSSFESIRVKFVANFSFSVFQAPFLPWVLLIFSVLLGNTVIVDLLGMGVGHLYFFLEDVFPSQEGGFQILKTPSFL